MEVHAGQFENVAKMSRLAQGRRGFDSRTSPSSLPLKFCCVEAHPDLNPTGGANLTDSDDDDVSRKQQSVISGRTFTSVRSGNHEKTPYTGEPDGIDISPRGQADRERWRNKQRQREKYAGQGENDENLLENRRKNKLTRRQRDERFRNNQNYVPGPIPHQQDPYSDTEARYRHAYHHQYQSGYASPAVSCDERMMSRSMSAAPRRVVRTGPTRKPGNKEGDDEPLLEEVTNINAVSDYFHRTVCPHQQLPPSSSGHVTCLCRPSVGSVTSPQHPSQEFLERLSQQLIENRGSFMLQKVNNCTDLQRSGSGNFVHGNDGSSSRPTSAQDRPMSAAEQILNNGKVMHPSGSMDNQERGSNSIAFSTDNQVSPLYDKKVDSAQEGDGGNSDGFF